MSAPASAKDLEAPKVVPVDPAAQGARVVKGVEFNDGVDYAALVAAMRTTGFQATQLGLGIETVDQMLDERLTPVAGEAEGTAPADRCKIFLGFTSNVISVRPGVLGWGQNAALTPEWDHGLSAACARRCASWWSTRWSTCS